METVIFIMPFLLNSPKKPRLVAIGNAWAEHTVMKARTTGWSKNTGL